MVEEPESRNSASGSEKKPKKKIIPLALLLALSFLGLAVGNYFHLKSTYVPPPPPKVEEEQEAPVLTIDLGELESHFPPAEDSSEALDRVQTEIAAWENSPHLDSIKRAIAELNLSAHTRDSLLQALQRSLTEAKKPEPVQETKVDSVSLKQSAKLAKIVENMDPTDAAKMLEPLSNDMVMYILLRLKQRQAAQVMAALPPARSAAISRAIMEPVVMR